MAVFPKERRLREEKGKRERGRGREGEGERERRREGEREGNTALIFGKFVGTSLEEVFGNFHVAVDNSKMNGSVVFHP